MKRLFICLLVSFLLSCVNSFYNINTRINSDIDSSLREELFTTSKTLIEAIKKGEQTTIEKTLSPLFIHQQGYDFRQISENLTPFLKKYEFTLMDEYYSIINNIGVNKNVSIIPVDEEKFVINNLIMNGKESYNMFYKSEKEGTQYLLFLSFSKYDSIWKSDAISMGDYSITHLNASQLYKIALKIKEAGRLPSAGIYTIALNKVLRPAQFLQYKEEKVFSNFIQSTSKELNNFYRFPFMLDNVQIIGLNIEVTTKEGILPVILYITSTPLKEPEIKEEAIKLKRQILSTFSQIEIDFKSIIMSAYNEAPIDPTKQYMRYNTIYEIK